MIKRSIFEQIYINFVICSSLERAISILDITKMNKINPQICLIYGLQGTGKTTVSYKLFQLLKKKGVKKIKVVDGDDFRKKIKNFKYDSKSRELVGKKKYKYILNYYKKKYLIITSSVTGKPFMILKISIKSFF